MATASLSRHEDTVTSLAHDFRRALPGRLRGLVHDCEQLACQPSENLRQSVLFDLHKLAGTAASFGMTDLALSARQVWSALGAACGSMQEVEACDLAVSVLRGKFIPETCADSASVELVRSPDIPSGGGVVLFSEHEAGWEGLRVRLAELGMTSLHIRTGGTLPCVPELLLIDIDGKDGHPDLKRVELIRAHQDAGLNVFAVASVDTFEVRLLISQNGGSGMLCKPLVPAMVLELLAQVRERRREQPIRVLVVDDARELSRLYQVILESAGMEAFIEPDPAKVLQALNRFRPELLLIDQHMPGWRGEEVAAAIRSYSEFTSLPIIFLSGENDKERQLQALTYGQAEDFLVKPIRPDTLIAVVLNRALRFRALRRLMAADSLTRLYNHAAIVQELENELARARRMHGALSVALIDLDHFKEVNDRWGHPVGDDVLRSLSEMMRQRLRAGDTLGRYGGEEFLLVLPNTDIGGAMRIVDELRQCFERLPHRAGTQQFNCTFSCGIAVYTGTGTGKRLIERADKALYGAKHGGRNQIQFDWKHYAKTEKI